MFVHGGATWSPPSRSRGRSRSSSTRLDSATGRRSRSGRCCSAGSSCTSRTTAAIRARRSGCSPPARTPTRARARLERSPALPARAHVLRLRPPAGRTAASGRGVRRADGVAAGGQPRADVHDELSADAGSAGCCSPRYSPPPCHRSTRRSTRLRPSRSRTSSGLTPERQSVWLSRGIARVGPVRGRAGWCSREAGSGVLETINQVGLGILRTGARGVRAGHSCAASHGTAAGRPRGWAARNLALARFAPGVSWLWWNPAGFFVTCAVALPSGTSRRDRRSRSGRAARRAC